MGEGDRRGDQQVQRLGGGTEEGGFGKPGTVLYLHGVESVRWTRTCTVKLRGLYLRSEDPGSHGGL